MPVGHELAAFLLVVAHECFADDDVNGSDDALIIGHGLLEDLEVFEHAVLADLGMPGIDGFELIARIRRSRNTGVRNVPAAALTAYARSDDRIKALRQGFQIHLAKPVDPAELVAAIASLTRHSQTTAF